MKLRTTQGALGEQGSRGLRAALVPVLVLVVAAVFPASAAADDIFPVSLADDEGSLVTIEAEPQRIISLSPANTEIVFALGLGDRLVGGTDYDDYPAAAAELPDVATFTGVIMEQVVAARPDLVLAGGSDFTNPDDITRMRDLGYPVLVTYPTDVGGVFDDIELIGRSIGASEAAMALTEGMAADIAAIEAATSELGTRPRTFYEVGSEPEIYGPADDSFLADMVVLAGGEPVTSGDPIVWSIPVERLIEADPEVIIVGDALWGVCPSDVAARPGWDSMTAVRDGGVRTIGFADVTRPGPRLAEAVAAIARAIHPDIDLEAFPEHPDPCEAG